MPLDMKISIVSPDRTVVEERTVSVVAPGVLGYLGVWPGHEPLVTELQTGIITYQRPDKTEELVAVCGG